MFKQIFGIAALALSLTAAAQQPPTVVDLPTRPGVTQRMLVTTPPEPKATVILLAGSISFLGLGIMAAVLAVMLVAMIVLAALLLKAQAGSPQKVSLSRAAGPLAQLAAAPSAPSTAPPANVASDGMPVRAFITFHAGTSTEFCGGACASTYGSKVSSSLQCRR